MKRLIGLALVFTIFALPATTFAHSKVTPAETGIAESETFTATVENEKEIPTTSVRVVLPDGLEDVEPYAKSGWTVKAVKEGDETKEIIWTGGEIPGELKDTFAFDAQAPSTVQTITWKIYQTYADGTVVSWANTDKNAEKGEGSDSGPASYTKIVDDLAQRQSTQTGSGTGIIPMIALVLGATGTLIGIAALLISVTRKNSTPDAEKADL